MKINPSGSIGRVVGGPRLLGKAGHDTGRHLACAALAVEDSHILSKADALRDHFQDFPGKVDIGISQKRIANQDKPGHLVAFSRDSVEHELQLIERAAALRPDGRGNGAADHLARLAVHRADPYPVHQLRIPEHVLADYVQEHQGDSQFTAGNSPVLSLHGTKLGKEGFHIILGQDGVSLLHGQGIKGPLIGGQFANVDSQVFVSPFGFSFGFVGGGGVALYVGELPLELFDFLLQIFFLLFVGGFVAVVFFDFFLHRFPFFVRALRRFIDCVGQIRFTGQKIRVFCADFFQFLLFAVDLPPHH